MTLIRTAVEVDYRGDVIDAHEPEMPTRFAKQLTQIMRGAVAIGMSRDDALALTLRCARDSMPQLRFDILRDVAAWPGSRVSDVRKHLQKPRNTVDRTLQALHILRLLICDEEELESEGGNPKNRKKVWTYRLAAKIDLSVLEGARTDHQSSSRKLL